MTLTVVMYHYVRPRALIEETGIPGLPLDRFVAQLRYLQENYTILDPEEFLQEGCPETGKPPALLTFDDAYTDHYEYAIPEMLKIGVKGIFFAPAKAVEEHALLDVNKIHYILGKEKRRGHIINIIHEKIREMKSDYDLMDLDEYVRLYKEGAAFRPGTRTFDDKETTYIKRILQVGLPEKARKIIIDDLFERIIGENEEDVAMKTYCSRQELKEMADEGMTIGGHGYKHGWMEFMSHEEALAEVVNSRNFLDTIYGDGKKYYFAYPYGSYREDLFREMQDNNFVYAFTTIKGTNEKGLDRMKMERLDTNDVPA